MTRAESLAAVLDDLRALDVQRNGRCPVVWSDPLGRHTCALAAGHTGQHVRSRYDQEEGR